MKIEGRLRKAGKWWAVEIPLLALYTQGKNKAEAYLMAKDAVESMIDSKGFVVEVFPSQDNTFSISSNNDVALMAFALKQQRGRTGLSIRQVAERMGSNSPTAYSRYENGKTKPTLDKFSELLTAIDPELEPILKIG